MSIEIFNFWLGFGTGIVTIFLIVSVILYLKSEQEQEEDEKEEFIKRIASEVLKINKALNSKKD